MAENNGTVAGAQQHTEQRFQCTGNCMKCIPQQRAYCACQHAYSNMMVLDRMMDRMTEMKQTIKMLSEKIESIQNNEACVFDPNAEVPIGKPEKE